MPDDLDPPDVSRQSSKPDEACAPGDPGDLEETHPYRGAPKRPRIWVPGLLDVVPPAPWDDSGRGWRLHTGPLAGLWDGFDDVTDWKTTRIFVALVDLELDMATRAEVLHPAVLPLDLRPHVRALVARAPLLEITDSQAFEIGRRLIRMHASSRPKVRFYSVGFARNADDFFSFSAWSDHSASRGDIDPNVSTHVSGARYSLERSTLPKKSGETAKARGDGRLRALHEDIGDIDASDPDTDNVDDEQEIWVDLMDRILETASDGMVHGASMSLGTWLKQITTQYSSTYPHERAEAERTLDEIEAELGEIAERGQAHRHEAQAIVAALRDANDRGVTGGSEVAPRVNVAIYGTARARVLPAVTIRTEPRGASGVPLGASVHRVIQRPVADADTGGPVDPTSPSQTNPASQVSPASSVSPTSPTSPVSPVSPVNSVSPIGQVSQRGHGGMGNPGDPERQEARADQILDELEIPAKLIWYVRDVEPWEPPLRAANNARTHAARQATWAKERELRSVMSSRMTWILAATVLVALAGALIHAVR